MKIAQFISGFLACGALLFAPASTMAQSAPQAVQSAPTATPPMAGRDLAKLLQDGLFEEEANRNLEKAAAAYEALLESFDQQRRFAATAVFRLAEVRAKQQRKEDAIALYQKVITEFANDPLAQLSRERLGALGGKLPAVGSPSTNDKEAQEIARLQDLVKNSPDLLNAATDTLTPIGRAAIEGWLQAATFLLDHGADPGPRYGAPALHMAASYGRKAMVELLIARKVDLNARDSVGRTALIAAVAASRVEVVRVLLEAGARPNETNREGHTALHLACAAGHNDLARILLDKGADINAISPDARQTTVREVRDSKGKPVPGRNTGEMGTPLMAAVLAGRPETVKLLLDRKADVNVEAPKGTSALTLAIKKGNRATAALLLEHGANAKLLGVFTGAVAARDLELVRLVAKHGADFDEQNPLSSGTALHVGVSESMELTKLLLERGASPNATNAGGQTSLHVAMQQFPQKKLLNAIEKWTIPDPFETCKLLVARGAKVNAQDAEGRSAFHLAMGSFAVPEPVLEWLLAQGADPNLPDKTGATPADYASTERRLWLEERVLFRPWTKEKAVHVVFRLGGLSTKAVPYRATPVADFDTPPPADELVRRLAEQAKNEKFIVPQELQLLVYRADGGGQVKKAEQVQANLQGDTPNLPSLQWGDILVIAYFGQVQSGQFRGDALLKWKPVMAKPVPRKLIIGLGDRKREVMVHGDHWDWDPVAGPLPEWGFSALIGRATGAEPRADLSAVKVQRQVGEKVKEWVIDLRPETPGESVKTLRARLADGDRIEIPLLPEGDAAALARRRAGIFRAAPGRLFGEKIFDLSPSDDGPRTLGELIAEAYFVSSMLIPQPDLAHLRIHRMKGEGEETIEIDLASRAAKVSAHTSEEDARKLDVPLMAGDIVEFGTAPEGDLDSWNGLSGEMQIFLRKALSRIVAVGGGTGPSFNENLAPVFAEFRQVSTAYGTIWQAGTSGKSPFRAWSVVRNAKNLLKVRVRSQGKEREFTPETIQSVNPWLIDQDEVVIERY